MHKIFENKYATLYLYQEKGIIHHEIHKFVHGEKFRELLLVGEKAFVEHNCTKWLSDERLNSTLPEKDSKWIRRNWQKRVMLSGWKYWAICLPVQSFGKENMKKVIGHYTDMGIEIAMFKTPDEALKWLEEQE